ncbi:unnamed protein product [Linum trigynum]
MPPRRRRWDELCRDLLNSIYIKLLPPDRADFGCVCKSCHHIHASAVAAAPPPTTPVSGKRGHPIDVGSHVGEDVPGGFRELLSSPYLRVFYNWASGWWLVGYESIPDSIFGCFNPLLPWPFCYFRLPILRLRPLNRDPFPQPPIKAAFSAPPTGPDWTVLIVNSHRSFSTFRRGRLWWESYTYCREGEEGKRVCEGIGFRGGRFFLLFDTGDVLIFGACSKSRMLVAAGTPLLAGELRLRENLCVVAAAGDEESVAVSWERGGEGGGRSFRLVAVEKDVTPAMKELQLEEGSSRGGVLMATEQRGTIKRITYQNSNYMVTFLCILWVLLMIIYVVIITFVPGLNLA